MKYYVCKVAYERQDAVHGTRKVTERYLVDALSFTEAEERITAEISPFVSYGELEVVDIRTMLLADILRDGDLEADKFYRAKLNYTVFNDKTEAEKKQAEAVLIRARDFSHAFALLEAFCDQHLSVSEVTSLTETDLSGFWEYTAQKEEER